MLGYTNDIGAAGLVKANFINRFTEQGIDGIKNTWVGDELLRLVPTHMSEGIVDSLHYPPGTGAEFDEEDWKEYIEETKYHKKSEEVTDGSNRLLSGMSRVDKAERKKLMEKIIDISKMPKSFNPSGESKIKGGLPTKDESSSSSKDYSDMLAKNKDFPPDSGKSSDKTSKGLNEFVKSDVQHIKLQYQNKSPQTHADDFPLSIRKKHL